MTVLLIIYLFIFGLVFGSFYNVVGIRLAHGESIVAPRSHCPNCGHVLGAFELIPVFSWIFLRGKCKECSKPVSPRYAIFELLTAALFAVSPLLIGWSLELAVALTLVSLVIIITISDIDSMIIPNKVLLFFAIVGVGLRLFIHTDPWWSAWLGPIIAFAVLIGISAVSRDGMGGGDIKLFTVLGLYVGAFGVILTLVLAAVLGLIIGGLILLITKRSRKEPIPFGPFIATAALIIYFYYDQIYNLLNSAYHYFV